MGWKDRQWFFGEIEAMKTVLAVCERWGYGNVMQVISDAWNDKFPGEALTPKDFYPHNQARQRGTRPSPQRER
jgi:hypothetical protein